MSSSVTVPKCLSAESRPLKHFQSQNCMTKNGAVVFQPGPKNWMRQTIVGWMRFSIQLLSEPTTRVCQEQNDDIDQPDSTQGVLSTKNRSSERLIQMALARTRLANVACTTPINHDPAVRTRKTIHCKRDSLLRCFTS